VVFLEILHGQAKSNSLHLSNWLCRKRPSTKIQLIRIARADMHESAWSATLDPSVLPLREAVTSEDVPLAKRFRALFSLKHLASQQPPTRQTLEAIHAIAAAFSSPSALLKHELAYCLGQTKNLDAVPFLRHVLENREEDEMCRHEAAEALGALGDMSSVDLMRQLQYDENEPTVVRETCDIAVARILWEKSDARVKEKLKKRLDGLQSDWPGLTHERPVISLP
jgi:deoxyhypusine monooxygenase